MTASTSTSMVITASQLTAELVARGIRKDDRDSFPYGAEAAPFWSSRRNVPIDPEISVINVVHEGGLLNWFIRYVDATGEINHVSISDGGGYHLLTLDYWPGFEGMVALSSVLERTWVPHCIAQGDWEDAQQEADE